MIREVLTQGVGKEFQRSLSIDRLPLREGISKNSPRHGLMAGVRHPQRSPFNWISVFLGVFLIFLAVILVLNNSNLQPMAPLDSLNSKSAADSTSVHVAYLALKVAELQEKVQKASTAAQETAKRTPASKSVAGVLTILKLERTFTRDALMEISTGLDGIAKLLQKLKKSGNGVGPLSSNPKESFNIASKDMEPKQETPVHSLDLPGRNPSPSEPLYDFFDREEIRKYIKVTLLIRLSRNCLHYLDRARICEVLGALERPVLGHKLW